MSLSNLRQGASRVSNQTGGSKGGGKGGFFNKWRPPKLTPQLQGMLRPNEPPGDAIMLVRPDELYDDVYDTDEQGRPRGTKTEALHFMFHQVKKMKDGKERFDEFTCSAGTNPHAPQPCVGEVCVDQGMKNIASARQNWAFNIKHLVPYHEIPLVKDGKIQMRKDKPNEQVLILRQCEVGTPEMRARAYNPQTHQFKPCQYCVGNAPVIFGAPKVYQLGKNHLEELLKVGDSLDQTCGNCMTRLIKEAYNCSHCHKEILDVGQSGFVNEQLKQFAETPQQCRTCGAVALPEAVYDCGWDPTGMYKVQGGCPENVAPRAMSVFDCVIFVYRQGEGQQTEIVVSAPVPKQHFRTPDGRPLDDHLKAPHLSRSFDLKQMYAVVPADKQAEICGIPNPYGPQQQQYGQYPPQGGAPPPYQPPTGAPPPYAPPQGYQQQPPGYPQPQQPPQQGYQQPSQPAFPQQQMPPGMPFTGRPDYK